MKMKAMSRKSKGRPRLKETRTESLEVRLTRKELAMFQQTALRCALPLSAWARYSLCAAVEGK